MINFCNATTFPMTNNFAVENDEDVWVWSLVDELCNMDDGHFFKIDICWHSDWCTDRNWCKLRVISFDMLWSSLEI